MLHYTDDGTAYGTRLPSGVLLHHIQAGRLRLADVAVYMLLEDRAGRTSLAKMTRVEIGALLGMDRDAVSEALVRLGPVGRPNDRQGEDVGEATVVGVAESKRGEWQVLNPAHRSRNGDLPRDITYANRTTPTPPPPPRPPTSPQGMPEEPALAVGRSLDLDGGFAE